jgi:hypothetical protein
VSRHWSARTRLREIEDKQALGNEAKEIEEWLFTASEQLELMAKEVREHNQRSAGVSPVIENEP